MKGSGAGCMQTFDERPNRGRGRFSVSFQVGLYFNRHSVLNFLKEP